MRLRAASSLLLLATACAAEAAGGAKRAAAPTPHEAPPSARGDAAVELAQELPEGADRCVVVRPGALDPARRSLLARVSQAEPLAWVGELAIEAYASAQRERRDGPADQVSLLRVSDPDARVRAVLSERLALDWNGVAAGCETADCPARARFVRPHVVRIDRGNFTAGPRNGGVSAHCLRLARHRPQALELSVARTRGLDAFALSTLPLRSSVELHADAGAVRVARFDLMRGGMEAEQALQEGPLRDPLSTLGGELRRYRVDAAVHTEIELAWEDLELAQADDARIEEAARDTQRWLRAQPDGEGLPARREDVLAELGHRLELIERASGEARRSEAEAARRLLEAALARDPDDEGLARLLTELLLAELRQPEPARALIQRFAGRSTSSKEWAALARHAAALSGVDALAEALVRDRLVERRAARGMARSIVARLEGGLPYAQAERASLVAEP